MQNLYTVWIVKEKPGSPPRFVPWHNVPYERAATWEKTQKDIIRVHPDVHHVIVRDQKGLQVAYFRYEGGTFQEVFKKPYTPYQDKK